LDFILDLCTRDIYIMKAKKNSDESERYEEYISEFSFMCV